MFDDGPLTDGEIERLTYAFPRMRGLNWRRVYNTPGSRADLRRRLVDEEQYIQEETRAYELMFRVFEQQEGNGP